MARRCFFVVLLGLSGCLPLDDGTPPPLERLYFPTGMALSAGGDRLYVANSNFDLQFNAGTLQVLDAEQIRAHLLRGCMSATECSCGDLPEVSTADRFLSPAICGPLDMDSGILLRAARIAPFVTDLQYTLFTDEQGRVRARIFLPARGDATLHWADVENDLEANGPVLDCGQNKNEECDDNHRRGQHVAEGQTYTEHLPTEPFSVAITPDGRSLVVAHQLQGMLSLFHNTASGPELKTVLSGLPVNPMGVAALPPPLLATVRSIDYQPAFLVTFRHSSVVAPTLELIRYFDDDAAAPGRPYLQRASSAPITTSSNGSDSRGIAVDDVMRGACETACIGDACSGAPNSAAECAECLSDCAKIPLRVYVANRAPDALLIGETGLTRSEPFRDDLPSLSDAQALRGGPSRVFVGKITNEHGNLETRVFVIAFDSRYLYIYNPESRVVETRIQTGRGPHALAIDEPRGLGYLAHFTDSYIGVLDLDKRNPTYGHFLLSVGRPTPPRSAR